MKLVARSLAWACVLVCVVAVVAAWVRARPELNEQDAIDFTETALVEAGLTGVSVEQTAVQDIQSNPGGDLAVWRTRATVEGGAVELAVRRDLGQAVFVRDTSDGGDPLLTDAQVERLGDFRTDPAVDRRITDNIVITVAAALCGLVAVALATSRVSQNGRSRAARSPSPVESPGERRPVASDRAVGRRPEPVSTLEIDEVEVTTTHRRRQLVARRSDHEGGRRSTGEVAEDVPGGAESGDAPGLGGGAATPPRRRRPLVADDR